MKAAVYDNYGPPEVVRLSEIAKPVPGTKEVLIKVHATTVNRTDCGFRSANYFITRFWSGLLRPKNRTLGTEFAGIVEAAGKEVTLFSPGDRVFGYNDKQCGAHAEYMVTNEHDCIATLPFNASFEQSAAITEGAHYALCDIRAAKIKSGQKILVNGGTGAIGSAAVQILKHLGADVTAVCHTKDLALVRSLGASVVIDYTQEDFTRLNETFDVVFDAVGKSSFGKCAPLLKKNGIYMSTELGPYSQNPFLAMFTHFIGDKKVLFPIPTIDKADLNYLKGLVESGDYMPVIDRTYRLEQIVNRYVETGEKVGNVVISVCSWN